MSVKRTLIRIAAPVTAAPIAAALLAAPAVAGPPTNGCPPGYTVKSVDELSAMGYHVPELVDDPASGILSFGQLGNHDRQVCALPLGNQTTSFGGQIYNFWDNTLLTS